MRSRLLVWAALFTAAMMPAVAEGQFHPGHVYVAEASGNCADQDAFGRDRIWQIHPRTGQAAVLGTVPQALCGGLSGLTFTPDGGRLRAASTGQNAILEFDPAGAVTVVLNADDGIVAPQGLNGLAYDAEGNFYVLNGDNTILRFRPEGGKPQVVAGPNEGAGPSGALAFAADSDLYFTNPSLFDSGVGIVLRVDPQGNAAGFDDYGRAHHPTTISADRHGQVFVALSTGDILRYESGDPQSRESLVTGPWTPRYAMTISVLETLLYVHHDGKLYAIRLDDGSVTLLSEFSGKGPDRTTGIAVQFQRTRRGFVPGHVYANQATGKLCFDQDFWGGDEIWWIDPDSGEADLFVTVPKQECGFLLGAIFTPDGSRLRVWVFLRRQIVEYDHIGTPEVVLGPEDGLGSSNAVNNMAYDAAGNFYAYNSGRQILRFPGDGGPATVFADADDGVGSQGGSMAFAADGDLYFTNRFLDNESVVRRITSDGQAFPFDSYRDVEGRQLPPGSLGADMTGRLFVALSNGELLRYQAGFPETRETILESSAGVLAVSHDDRVLYMHRFRRLFAVDLLDLAVTDVTGVFARLDLPLQADSGIAVVPGVLPPPPPPPTPVIPTVTLWGCVVLILSLMVVARLSFRRVCGCVEQTTA